MKPPIEEYRVTKRAVAGIVMAIVLIVLLGSYVGGSVLSTTATVAKTTVNNVTTYTATYSNISSYTMTSIVVRTTQTFVTITEKGPDTVQVSGTVATHTIGTVAQFLVFQSVTSNQTTFRATVTEGKFQQVLPNRDFYNVAIEYGTVAGGVGSGKCSAGALVLFILDGSLVSNWSC